MLEPLYFISQPDHIDTIREALEAGCRLIQLRVKNEPEQQVHKLAQQANALCDTYNAKLIINDFPAIAKAVNAYGIHVGLLDLSIKEVRAIVGPQAIIGGTANTFEHIQQRLEEGADYIGLGPYRFTTTKEKLSPILGLQGFRQLLQQCAGAGIHIPIVAIGGIVPGDAPALFDAGVHTIAVSGALINAANKKQLVDTITRQKHSYAPDRQ